MKKSFVCLITVTVLAFTACNSAAGGVNGSESRMEYISTSSAKEVALSDSGVAEADVKNISTELKSKDGRDYYEVDFSTNNEEVSYDVDALTGAVLSSKHEKKGTSEPTMEQSSDQSAAQPPAQSAAQSPTQTPSQSSQSGNKVILESSNTTPTKEYVSEQPAKQPQLTPATENVLSEARIKELVLARIPGATNANFVEFHKDYDDGRVEYDGKVIYQNTEYEFEIDAYSGAFRDWDVEFFWD